VGAQPRGDALGGLGVDRLRGRPLLRERFEGEFAGARVEVLTSQQVGFDGGEEACRVGLAGKAAGALTAAGLAPYRFHGLGRFGRLRIEAI
jgi:hypothetical protein